MVKFGDIAKHISKRVEPSETNLDIYVGLEHLDPDSLKIKRHGVPSASDCIKNGKNSGITIHGLASSTIAWAEQIQSQSATATLR
jgi:hypothetical protein